MQKLARVLLLGLTVQAALAQQASKPEIVELKNQLNQALSRLETTETELQRTRAEIEALKQRLDLAESVPSRQLEQIQQNEEVNASRTETLDQSKVESESKYRIKVSGMVLFNAGWNRGGVDNLDVPDYADEHAPGQPSSSIFGSFRQTFVGLQIFGPHIVGARTSGAVDFDFFGGFTGTLDGNVLGIARLRTANLQLDWQRWNLQLAQDTPFVSPLNPTSLASIGTPSLGHSGNLWTWTPQVVLTRRWSTSDHFSSALQVGVLDPLGGEFPPAGINRIPESGELTRMPAFGLRQSWTWGHRGSSVGASGYFAQHNYGFARRVDSWAGMMDWKLPVSDHIEFSGEFYRGQALGGLWGGGGTSATFDGDPADPATLARAVNTVGGWAQLKIKPSDLIEFNSVFGEDNPFAQDVLFSKSAPFNPFLRNQTFMFNVIGHPMADVLISLEYRHLNSKEINIPRSSAEHVNIAIGYKF